VMAGAGLRLAVIGAQPEMGSHDAVLAFPHQETKGRQAQEVVRPPTYGSTVYLLRLYGCPSRLLCSSSDIRIFLDNNSIRFTGTFVSARRNKICCRG